MLSVQRCLTLAYAACPAESCTASSPVSSLLVAGKLTRGWPQNAAQFTPEQRGLLVRVFQLTQEHQKQLRARRREIVDRLHVRGLSCLL